MGIWCWIGYSSLHFIEIGAKQGSTRIVLGRTIWSFGNFALGIIDQQRHGIPWLFGAYPSPVNGSFAHATGFCVLG
jgi:hypothetical protein